MSRRSALLLGAVCIFATQAIVSRAFQREPFLPTPPPLSNIALHMGGWSQISEETVPPDALEMLGPDDFVARLYRTSNGDASAELFVAYYKTQLRAKNAHDPKVCLPGAGWNPIDSHLVRISEPGSAVSFPANYYRIKKDEDEQIVLYWFQTPKGIYTYEQQLRLHRVLDSITDNRTDMALVRIIVPVTDTGLSSAESSAEKLAQDVYREMLPYFPPAEGRNS